MAYSSWSVVFGEQPSAAKWNILGTNDASFNDGTGIGNGAISSPQKLVSGAGTSWAFQTYSPTLTNITEGNGTKSFYYLQVGKFIKVQGRFTLGTTSSISGVIQVSLPATAVGSRYTARETLGDGVAFHAASGAYNPCSVVYNSTTTVKLVAWTTTTGANPVFMDISSARDVSNTTPFASAANTDFLSFNFSYEAA